MTPKHHAAAFSKTKTSLSPPPLVRERFRLITSDHITGILESLWENHAQVRNPKAYLLAALFNAPTSTNNQITMQVSHDYPRGG